MMNKINGLIPKDIRLTDGFWLYNNQLLSNVIIPYQWDTLNNRTPDVPLSHAVENFRIAAGEFEGTPEGTIFQDSDVAKWIEAASYSLMNHPNQELERIIDELVRLIGKSQHKNGYLNTFFTAKGIDQRWTDLVMGHEMYCAGHLIEAAVAYYLATGKKEFLEIMSRYADLIREEFGVEDHKLHSYDGHPEIEMALYRLGQASGKTEYMDLADYFINIRGSVDNFYKGVAAKEGMIPKSRWFESDYYLAHKPVREMREVTGHSVRAVYLYASMADQYRRTNDPALWKSLRALWDNLEKKRVYITGGIGSQSHGERFTTDYDLPPERGYTETCASIGLIFWAWRMSLIDPDRRYADMIERSLYNGSLSGISLDGKGYFYVNPLEVKPDVANYRQDLEHVETHRLGWFDCACCPTNIARLIGSIGQYIYSFNEDYVYIHQYISSRTNMSISQQSFTIEQKTEFPWGGHVAVKIDTAQSAEFKVALRIPDWCTTYNVSINGSYIETDHVVKGYLIINRIWNDKDRIELDMDMKVQFIQADSRIPDYSGKAALMRGPIVYCLEEADNGPLLHELIIDPAGQIDLISSNLDSESAIDLFLSGYRESVRNDDLYVPLKQNLKDQVRIKAIPYYQWGNRDKDKEMSVWFRVQ